jgi:hypothetical protein
VRKKLIKLQINLVIASHKIIEWAGAYFDVGHEAQKLAIASSAATW